MQRLARVIDKDGRYTYGWVTGLSAEAEALPTSRFQPIVGDIFGEHRAQGEPQPLSAVRLLAPIMPSKIIGIGSNYRDHAAEMGKPVPPVPKVFLKPPTALVGPNDPIPLPPGTERVDHEAELAVVVGRTLYCASPEECLAGVLGYTCGNDVTARDFQRADGVFARGKGFDGFCPIGPWLVLGPPPARLGVRAEVNGQVRQDGNTDQMVFDTAALLSFVSHIMTLLPGDLLLTGTPAGVGPLVEGDVVDVILEGVGRLSNPVADRADRAAARR
jgi:2-keto-4-pentenoate hydratase/2-oxohepta-3-ene-1,7-dioic acid hydratase in catechol pathway